MQQKPGFMCPSLVITKSPQEARDTGVTKKGSCRAFHNSLWVDKDEELWNDQKYPTTWDWHMLLTHGDMSQGKFINYILEFTHYPVTKRQLSFKGEGGSSDFPLILPIWECSFDFCIKVWWGFPISVSLLCVSEKLKIYCLLYQEVLLIFMTFSSFCSSSSSSTSFLVALLNLCWVLSIRASAVPLYLLLVPVLKYYEDNFSFQHKEDPSLEPLHC